MEDAGDGVELVQLGQWFEARYDGYIDPDLPAALHELEVLFVVEKHLGDDVVGPGVYLGLGLLKVEVQVG